MSATAPTPPRCPLCGEVVGAYEPAVSVTADGVRIDGARPAPDVIVAAVYHRDCVAPPER